MFAHTGTWQGWREVVLQLVVCVSTRCDVCDTHICAQTFAQRVCVVCYLAGVAVGVALQLVILKSTALRFSVSI